MSVEKCQSKCAAVRGSTGCMYDGRKRICTTGWDAHSQCNPQPLQNPEEKYRYYAGACGHVCTRTATPSRAPSPRTSAPTRPPKPSTYYKAAQRVLPSPTPPSTALPASVSPAASCMLQQIIETDQSIRSAIRRFLSASPQRQLRVHSSTAGQVERTRSVPQRLWMLQPQLLIVHLISRSNHQVALRQHRQHLWQ